MGNIRWNDGECNVSPESDASSYAAAMKFFKGISFIAPLSLDLRGLYSLDAVNSDISLEGLGYFVGVLWCVCIVGSIDDISISLAPW